MNEGDDKLRKAWRELGSEGPATRIDSAILDASRRAVAPRRASQRWAVPVSLAAVLVLAVGVTLRMQQEQPGIETSMPLREEPSAAAPVPPMQAPAGIAPADTVPPPKPEKQVTPAPATSKDVAKPAPALRAQQKLESAAPKPFADSAPRAAPTPRPPAASAAQAAAAPPAAAPPAAPPPAVAPTAAPPFAAGSVAPRGDAPQPMPFAKTQAAPAAAANRAAQSVTSSVAAPAAEQARAKRDSRELAADAVKEAEKGPLERELDRIAQLRRDGRHVEADEALAKFRREHPDYRIPEAVWEQVKPR